MSWKRSENGWKRNVLGMVLLSSVCMQWADATDKYDRVAKEIQQDVETVRNSITAALKEVEEVMAEYKKKKEKEVEGVESTDYNVLQMYEWYEKEGTNADKKCLSHQRNLQMIRTGRKENLAQCFARVDACVGQMKDQAVTLNKLMEKYEATTELTEPCEQLDNQDECLSQALELAKHRLETMQAVVQRFDIFKKLKLYEVETNHKVCQSVSDIYKESEKTEIQLLVKCMSGAEDERTSVPTEEISKPAANH